MFLKSQMPGVGYKYQASIFLYSIAAIFKSGSSSNAKPILWGAIQRKGIKSQEV